MQPRPNGGCCPDGPHSLPCSDRTLSVPRSLYQKPRSAEENALFYQGLEQLHVWYGHEQSVCWMQSELPPGFAEKMEAIGLARSYEESGWQPRPCLQKPKGRVILPSCCGIA